VDELTLAVAGGGKTQSIIDACVDEDGSHLPRTLAITYTRTGQRELATRLRRAFAPAAPPAVIGWYAFLQRHFVRPYLPRLYERERLRGFNFDGDPGRYATGRARYLDNAGCAYRLHLAKLACLVMDNAGGAPIDRIERMYTHIYIDEVQDLVGWDLEILDRLLKSRVCVHVVGDLRQSLIETNPRDVKNKQYRGVEMLKWFLEREGETLVIRHQTETYRCNQQIADFADRIFGENYGFKKTCSQQTRTTGHDGVFAVEPQHVISYVEFCRPQCLRYSSASAKEYGLDFRNFGEVKGLTFERVLIVPTKPIEKFVVSGAELPGRSACGFYVGVTRAKHSVALALSAIKARAASLPQWRP
jgi:DNA helicase II / ATP-dependent DNA helicase PcrA